MNEKVEACLDLLHIIAAHYPPSLDSFIPRGQIQAVISDLTSLVPDEGDEYMAEHAASPTTSKALELENAQLREQLRVLIDEVATHKEVEAESKTVFVLRIDQLQQELQILRDERQTLYEQAAVLEETIQARNLVMIQNEEVKRINTALAEENRRLSKTNNALTQHMFEDSEAGSSRIELDDEVRDILTGRKGTDESQLIRAVARMYQKLSEERLKSERDIEMTHRRLRELESSPLSSPFANPDRAANASDQTEASLSSRVASFFRSSP